MIGPDADQFKITYPLGAPSAHMSAFCTGPRGRTTEKLAVTVGYDADLRWIGGMGRFFGLKIGPY
jgi:hypothetical protein